jgi:hypothetical protein
MQSQSDEWQTMDTAPKDGSVIELTAMLDGKPFEIWPMQWAHIQRNGFFPGTVGMWTAPDGSVTWNGSPDEGGPTHWRPAQASLAELGNKPDDSAHPAG